MKTTNKNAINSLLDQGWKYFTASGVVEDLVRDGFIEKDIITDDAELYAQAARDWVNRTDKVLTPHQVFNFASGWSTDSWEVITGDKLRHNITSLKNVFWALVILAKEAGVEL